MSNPHRKRIARIIEIFDASREPLFAVLHGIAQEDLDWSPAPGSRGIGKICRHVYRVDIWFLKRLGILPVVIRDGPGTADQMAGRMITIQEQIIAEVKACGSDEDLMAERTSLDGKTGARLGADVIHIAQHYLYHSAQMTYLRRIRDRGWKAPLREWGAAIHLIGGYILE